MGRVAMIREHWPSIPGHGEQNKLYPVKVIAEMDNSIIGKRHWWSRKEVFIKQGTFVWVEGIQDEHNS